MKYVADLHVHTISSGHAYSTMEEYAAQAKKIGLKAFALTDHGPAMPGGPHLYYFANMKMVPEKIDGVRLYRGCEVNIISADGEIDLSDYELNELEIVIASLHPRVGCDNQGEEKNTEVLIKTIKRNPKVNILGHIGNPKFPVNIPAVVAAAKEGKVLVELNNSSFISRPGSWDKCLQAAREIKKLDWLVALGTDSHASWMLGDFRKSEELIKAAGLSDKHIVNTSFEKIEKYLLER
ncbi:MAG: phosphatase [Candidatus Margulisbacteria bacterium]|nr:phosphatase [Candidatus Margulisiibacteriota bacterium]